jgi:hypothetical protein
MRRLVWALVFPVLWACSGQHLVPEERQTSVEKLESSLPSWCSQACDRLQTCAAKQSCQCNDDACHCFEITGGCATECEEGLAEYTHSETCADLALQMQRCIDYASCSQLMHVEDWPDCYPSEAARATCEGAGEGKSPAVSGAGGAPDE